MPIIVVLAATGLVAGLVSWAVASRWPRADPEAPHLSPGLVSAEVRRHGALRDLLRRRLHPAEATGLVLTAAVLVVVAGAATVGVVLAMVRSDEGLAELDMSAARFGASSGSELATTVLHAVTEFGGTRLVVLLAVVVALLESRRLPNRAIPGFLVLVIGGQLVVTNLTKLLVDRARPDINPLGGFSGASFPSGHSAAAAASLAAFALLLGRGRSRRSRAVLAGVATGLTAAVAASRVLLGVHWLTDVVAGVALGWAWFALCSIAFGGRLLHFGEPVEQAQHEAQRPMPADMQR
jgi:undecaprenyl-diphosphatase